MRRFLVIVILSYFTAYYYLDVTYWKNPTVPVRFESATNNTEKEEFLTQEASPSVQNISITGEKSPKLALLRQR